MKKFLLSIIVCMFTLTCVWADEIEDDYLDMAAGYCVKAEYAMAMEYLDKILAINPNNTKVMDLKKGLTHILNNDMQSYVIGVNPQVKQAQEYKLAGSEQGEFQLLKSGTTQPNAYLA